MGCSTGKRFGRASTVTTFLFLIAAQARAAEITGADVQAAIDKGVKYLRGHQGPTGRWSEYPGRPGGVTCLAALALLNAGVPVTDAALAGALDEIRNQPDLDTYVVGLKSMVLAAADPAKYHDQLSACAKWLVDAQVKTGAMAGMWHYQRIPRGGDNSNTQYAVLGLDACARAGIPIDPQVWRRVETHFRTSQNADGGWAYQPNGQSSYGSMASAGLASLYLTGARLQTDFGPHVCGQYKEDVSIARAINWFAANFSVTANPPDHGPSNLYYYLYGLERVGMISARKYLGAHNWYKEGAGALVRSQQPNGSWSLGAGGIIGDANTVVNASFALLFLAKGQAPVLIQKLHWRGDWADDLYDAEHLVRFVGAQWKQPLSWQVVESRASVEDLLDAPILCFNGHTSPVFDGDEKQRLKDYVDQGGFLLAEACCAQPGFDRGFRALMAELFPDPETKLKPLPADHPIYSAIYAWAGAKFLEGIDIHCRTAIVYLPQDLSCAWHQDRPADLGAFRLGANICAYATGMEPLKNKLDAPVTLVKVKEQTEDSAHRGALVIGKVRYNNQWNMDAQAIPKLLAEMTAKANLTASSKDHPLALTDPDLYQYPLLYLSGSYAFTLTNEEKTRLKDYLNHGGVLFANALCGKEPFDTSFRALMKEVLPNAELKSLPLDHPVYACGYDIKNVHYTRAVLEEHPDLDTPTLEGIVLGTRTAVFYSKYDIGCALDSGAVLHGKGYLRPCAFKLGTNIVLYALSF